MRNAKVQPERGTETPPQTRDADQKDARHFWFRVTAAGVLLLLAIRLVLWLFVDLPDSLAAKVSIVGRAWIALASRPLGYRCHSRFNCRECS